MTAATAAAYVDEPSVESFRRRVGTLYPHPISLEGRPQLWLKEDLDAAIDRLTGRNATNTSNIFDAASVL